MCFSLQICGLVLNAAVYPARLRNHNKLITLDFIKIFGYDPRQTPLTLKRTTYSTVVGDPTARLGPETHSI